MKFIHITIIIMLISGCNESQREQHKEIPKDTSGIILTANTALRIDPLVFSTRVGQLKKGQSVSILEKSKEKRAIGKSINYWYKIKTKKGYIGWMYGTNLRILQSTNQDSVKKYVNKFWIKESKELQKKLSGKWWSINKFEDYTNECLEIYKDGKYRSYWKGYEKGAKEGTYTIDFEKNEIKFDKGTTFKNNLNFIKMGLTYILKKELKDRELRFKKILSDIEKDRKERLKKQKLKNKSKKTKKKK